MAASNVSVSSSPAAGALYRRYRPGTFAAIRGQDHVVRALQGAVQNHRIVHAYLFSGPRGTGKTSTARVLAKALNCEQPVDGDACDVCASCVAITQGRSLDVVELDAASNNGVENIREITAGAWHGTPGHWKVYIIDEAHQLSKPASAALLKTLEEPPAHVIFVLATTDPHKILPTIRSRTQHLEFRLFSGDLLVDLLTDVSASAGLAVDDATIAAAVRLAHGSARDALSALDQVLATGGSEAARPAFDDLLSSLANADPVEALQSLATLAQQGWDPEQLAESFAGELRQVFLLLVAPDVADAVGADRDRLAQWGSQLGLARTVRAIETLGRCLRDMRGAPDRTVVLEVALVRLTKPELDDSVAALEERVATLERTVNSSSPATSRVPTTEPRPIGAAREPTPVAGERAEPAVGDEIPVAITEPIGQAKASAIVAPVADEVTWADFRVRFEQRVVPRLSRGAQSILKSSQVRSFTNNVVTIAVPSESMRQQTGTIASGLASALDHEFARTIVVEWMVDASIETKPLPAAKPRRTVAAVPEIDEMDDAEVAESEVVDVASVADHLISEMFPGAEEIT